MSHANGAPAQRDAAQALARIAGLARSAKRSIEATAASDARRALLPTLDAIIAEATERPPLTDRQAELLAMIRDHIAAHGYAPSFAELRDGMGVCSPASITRWVQVLVRKGYLKQEPKIARGLTVIP